MCDIRNSVGIIVILNIIIGFYSRRIFCGPSTTYCRSYLCYSCSGIRVNIISFFVSTENIISYKIMTSRRLT